MQVSINHFDTCLSCYVTDWSGIVLSVPVSGFTTIGDIRAMLEDEWDGVEAPEAEDVTAEEWRAALDDLFQNTNPADIFDSSLEDDGEDDSGESVYAYFRVRVEPETDEEKARAEAREEAQRQLVRYYRARERIAGAAYAEESALWLAAGAPLWQANIAASNAGYAAAVRWDNLRRYGEPTEEFLRRMGAA